MLRLNRRYTAYKKDGKFLILKKLISKYTSTFHRLCTPYVDDLTSSLYLKDQFYCGHFDTSLGKLPPVKLHAPKKVLKPEITGKNIQTAETFWEFPG